MRALRRMLLLGGIFTVCWCAVLSGAEKDFSRLFPEDGVPKGWLVRRWEDLAKPADEGVHWTVEGGVLHGSNPRGTWLISEKEYSDFILEFEFKLGNQGNSGVALRSPLAGDPAFDGLEVQLCDLRYKPDSKDHELSGALYRAVAPRRQVYMPNEWNRIAITAEGPRLIVILNGTLVQDLNLDQVVATGKRHDGTDAKPIKDRPRKGHIGFQELSRGGGQVMIRNARIKVLD